MGWSPTCVRDSQWKPPVHPIKQVQALEQDRAAGGREHRVVRDGGGALGRVVLQPRNRRLYAELRWQVDKKQRSQYLCEVTAESRAANLIAGWRRSRALGLTVAGKAGDGVSVLT